MRIIDAHAHLFDNQGYLKHLIAAMDENNIEKVCISGIGKLFKCVENEEIKNALKKFPDRLIGAYFIRPGVNNPEDIQRAYSQGFKMLKVTLPTKPYDDPTLFSLWEKAEELKMPILFHTGVITLIRKAKGDYISSWFMHPMRLEPITNSFPRLKMIIAHLGVHWNEEAAELIRMRPNVYADLSGGLNGWRVRADKIGIEHWLWWPDAFKKIVFGTDVFYNQISQVLQEDINRLDRLNIDPETRELIFSGNISKMVGEG